MEPVVVIITQARVGSTRLPNKLMMEPVKGITLLDIHLQNLKRSHYGKNVIVATTFENGVEKIIGSAQNNGVAFFQGSTTDVLDRFYKAAIQSKADYIVRVTSDCPFIDPELLDHVIDATIEAKADYGANILTETFPDGQDVEVVSFSALEHAWKTTQLPSDREHVTPYIRNNSNHKGGMLFTSLSVDWEESFSFVRMTVDQEEDFEAIKTLAEHCGIHNKWYRYTSFILDNPGLFTNQKIVRNEGYYNSLRKD